MNAKIATNSYSQPEPAHYKRENDRYYLKYKDQIAVFLPTKKKKLVELFPGLEKEISKFIKSQNINLKKESELLTVIDHINDLSSGT